MNRVKVSLIAFHAIVLLVCAHSVMSIMTGQEKQEMVLQHNIHRNMILLGEIKDQPKALTMPNMTWDTRLEVKAQQHADQCIFEHDTYKFREIPGYDHVGQNLAYFTLDFDPFQMWFVEHFNYNFTTGLCKKGELCGHYLQVVWANSTKIGCGKNFCKNMASDGQDAYLWTCNYAEGAWLGRYKPYEVDENAPPQEEEEVISDSELLKKNKMTEYEKKEMVNNHNYYREGLRDGQVKRFPKAEELNMLSWDNELEAKATQYGLQCKFWRQPEIERTSKSYKRFGQNYFGCANHYSYATATWFKMEKYYNYTTNTQTNEHGYNFKQLAWYKSKKIGCYKGFCGKFKIVICNYDKEAEKDARPYPETLEGTYNKKVGSKYSIGSSRIFLLKLNELRNKIKKGLVVGWPKAKSMPHVEWDRVLAEKAQTLAGECKNDYSPVQGKYGVIDAHTIDITFDYFKTWKSYGKDYGYESKCSGNCLKYTLLFTANATKVGCGYQNCPAHGDKNNNYVCLFNAKANPNGKPYKVDKAEYTAAVGSDMSFAERFKMLSLHNSYRQQAMDGEIFKQPVAAKMSYVKWNADLAKAAQKDIDPCKYKRFPNDANLPGVGSYVHLFSFYRGTPEQAVDTWFKTKWSYVYSSNSGSYTSYKYKIFVNSQISQIGCAVKNCPNTWGGIKFIKCNYAKMKFNELRNKRPYEKA